MTDDRQPGDVPWPVAVVILAVVACTCGLVLIAAVR